MTSRTPGDDGDNARDIDRRWIHRGNRRLEGQVNSSVTVADGLVFGGPRDGPLYAWDAESGDRQWFFPTGYIEEASPAVADGVLDLATDRIYAIDAATGRERWRYQPSNGLDTSPVVSDGVVFTGDHDGVMYAPYGPR